jgi:hypothetical protein
MLTRTRGSDFGNVIAVTAGLITIFVLSGRFFELVDYFTPGDAASKPDWLPKIEFTWYALIGSLATFAVGLLFRTPRPVVEEAARRRAAAHPELARS